MVHLKLTSVGGTHLSLSLFHTLNVLAKIRYFAGKHIIHISIKLETLDAIWRQIVRKKEKGSKNGFKS